MEQKAGALKDTSAAPLDWAPATFLIEGWIFSMGPIAPVTEKMPPVGRPSGIVVIFPRLLDGWIIVDETFRCAEKLGFRQQECRPDVLGELGFPCLLWIPGAKERQNSLGRWRIHILQQTFVECFTGGEAFLCSLGLAFVVDP